MVGSSFGSSWRPPFPPPSPGAPCSIPFQYKTNRDHLHRDCRYSPRAAAASALQDELLCWEQDLVRGLRLSHAHHRDALTAAEARVDAHLQRDQDGGGQPPPDDGTFCPCKARPNTDVMTVQQHNGHADVCSFLLSMASWNASEGRKISQGIRGQLSNCPGQASWPRVPTMCVAGN